MATDSPSPFEDLHWDAIEQRHVLQFPTPAHPSWQPTPWTDSKHAPHEVCDCHTDRTKHCTVCAEYGETATCECAAKAGG